jgi:hypothetical protein
LAGDEVGHEQGLRLHFELFDELFDTGRQRLAAERCVRQAAPSPGRNTPPAAIRSAAPIAAGSTGVTISVLPSTPTTEGVHSLPSIVRLAPSRRRPSPLDLGAANTTPTQYRPRQA